MSSSSGVDASRRGAIPMWWDPNSPASLLLPRVVNDGDKEERGGSITVDTFLSHDGTSCNEHELAALISILRAHEEYWNNDDDGDDDRGSFSSLKKLSRQYRKAVRDCIADWEDDSNNEKQQQQQQAENHSTDDVSLRLLKSVYSLMHLSDVFLPLLPSHFSLDYREDPFDKPGAATANMVRYLRYNLMDSAENADPSISEMISSAQPEQFGGDNGTLFWNLVRTCVLQGCLVQAWEYLSRHSLYVGAAAACRERRQQQQSSERREDGDEESYAHRSMEEIEEGFLILRELMTRAPLPGGRTDEFDDALGTTDWQDDVVQDAEYMLENLDVLPSDYKFWEIDVGNDAFGDYPLIYDPDVAARKHKSFRDYARACRSSFHLSRLIPELDSILAILCGDFSGVHFGSWAEKFCAELLYRHPDLRPRNLSARASRIVDEFQPDVWAGPIINIMEGNVGHAIQLLYVLGGASGAALPATMTSLLFNLLMAASILPPELSPRRVDYLCEAASAIVSSLSRSDPSAGAQLALRLLIPYAMEEGSPVVVAALAGILEHRAPGSDAEARDLLSLCRPLIERKSAHVLDGAAAVALCRFRHYADQMRPGGGMRWLTIGVDLESMVYTCLEQGACYRRLAAVCNSTMNDLLQSMLGHQTTDVSVYAAAQEMVSSVSSDAPSGSRKIREVRGLCHVFSLYDAVARNNDFKRGANDIVACLEMTEDDATGVRGPLVQYSMHWPLLRVATLVLAEEEQRAKTDAVVPPPATSTDESESSGCSSFTKEGIAILLERLEDYIALAAAPPTKAPPSDDDVRAVRESLARGLTRAFVAENAKKRKHRVVPPWSREAIEGLRSMHIESYAPSLQERMVEAMLDP